jgi:nicotinamidase/pyrazinamidase
LALNFCVMFTALDAINLSFKTNVIKDMCRGIDINAGDIDAAIKKMIDNNINII